MTIWNFLPHFIDGQISVRFRAIRRVMSYPLLLSFMYSSFEFGNIRLHISKVNVLFFLNVAALYSYLK